MKKTFKEKMMKLKLLTIIALAGSLNAVELRLGNGTFDWNMGITKFMDVSCDLDINTISISEPHGNLSFDNSKIYYFFNADIYSSDFVDQMTDLMSTPITHEFPAIGSVNDAIDKYTPIPTPSNYKIRGFDLNLGLGYDFYKTKKGFLGAGINTGLSLPVMEMKDLKKTVEFFKNILDATKTDIKTYKLGPSFTGSYELLPNLKTYGTFSFGLQTGTIENDWIKSEMDVDGSYSVLDFGVTYAPLANLPKLHITLGYSKKSWDVDDVEVNMFNVFEKDVMSQFNNDFSSSSAYLGVGYTF
jgi:hypothetical protein